MGNQFAPTIAIINETSCVQDSDLETYAEALQIQVTRDFMPKWPGCDANLVFVPKGKSAPSGSWQLAILDNADCDGALGYHDLTEEGRPLGKVFAKLDLESGLSVSITISHELLEMLADPHVNLAASDANGKLWFYEVCDACEDDAYGYLINGVLVSDFVLPSYFEPTSDGPYDFKGEIKSPFSLLPGGYLSYLANNGQWTQVTARETSGAMFKARPYPGSRRTRRSLPKVQWIRSDLKRKP